MIFFGVFWCYASTSHLRFLSAELRRRPLFLHYMNQMYLAQNRMSANLQQSSQAKYVGLCKSPLRVLWCADIPDLATKAVSLSYAAFDSRITETYLTQNQKQGKLCVSQLFHLGFFSVVSSLITITCLTTRNRFPKGSVLAQRFDNFRHTCSHIKLLL